MFLQQLFNGVMIGSSYALVAVGFTMVYGVLELVNFANGGFYMLGAYLSLVMFVSMKMGFLYAFIFSIIAVGVLGAFMDRLILYQIRKKEISTMPSIIATLGVGTFISNLLIYIYGSAALPYPDILKLPRVFIGNAVIMGIQIVITVLSLLIMLVLSFVVYKTRLGSAMRAISQNRTAAHLMGINVNQVIMITFFIGSMCAAISGIMMAMYYRSADTTMYLGVNMKTFASAVLGGVGVLPGAMVGGLIIGILESLFTGYVGVAYKDAISFLVLIIVLIFRPAGLFGMKKIDKA